MTEVMRFAMDDGTEEEVPRSEVQEFQKAATEHDEHPNEIQQLRVTGQDGRAEDIAVPTSEMEDFKAAAGEHGDTFTPLRTVEMANGTRKTMTVGELSKFLRSKEYLESEDHKANVQQQEEQGLTQGSVGLAGTVGALEGLVKGGWYGGSAVANKIAKAIPEVGVEIEKAIGNLAKGAGNITGSDRIHDVGDWLVRGADDAKVWLDKNLPSETAEWIGYSDWSTKVADKIGEVAAMAYKFAPGLAPKAGGTVLEKALAGGNNKLMETIFASDGVNAYAQTYDTALENGATPTQAAAEGGAAFLINYFGQKAMIKAGGIVEGVKNPALRFAGGAAATGDAMGVLGAENKALQNIAENKPVGEGVGEAFEEGTVEGVLFHSMNAVPGIVMGAMKSRADRKMYDEIARTEILEALKRPEGSAALAGLMDKEAGDAAIAARKAMVAGMEARQPENRNEVRRLAIEAGLPETMTTAEMYRVLDAVAQQRQALAERVRMQMSDEQADALAQAVEAEIVKGVEPGQPTPTGKEAEELFQKTWLRTVEKIQDAAVLDDPETRKSLVETARKQAASEIRNDREAATQELSRIKGAALADQLAEFERRGIATWEDAEADGLIGKDERGRWAGGARQALNIELHGTEKMKDAVKEGKLDGDLAEELITASYLDLGGLPPEERTAMIDRIIDQADGNAAEARRLLAEVAGTEARQPERGRLPETAYEGAVNAERMKGTELKTIDGGVMGVQRFPEVRVEISADGITVDGLTDELMSKPENTADVAALLTRLHDIAERNNLTVDLGDANAKAIADGMIDEIQRGGLEATQRKMDTRARLFKVLADTTLGNGTTFDEQSFKTALAETGNGRRWVDNHGNIYGFVDDKGVIHFNPATFSMNTPIHEYGHVALEAVKRINPKLWEKGMELIEGTAYLDEIERYSKTDGHEYSYLRGNREAMKDEALATMIGDRGEKLVVERGLEAKLKEWIKEVWKAFKEAFGVADLTDEQIERMSIDDFVNVMNAELLRGREFGLKNRRNSTLNRKPLTKARSFEQHYQLQEEQEQAAEAERWANSGMNARDYILSRVEEGEPAFDLDWETAREIANDASQGRFSIGGLYTGSAADYEKPSLLKVGTGEGSQVYGWGLYASSEHGVAEGYARNALRDDNSRLHENGKKIFVDRMGGKVMPDVLEAYRAIEWVLYNNRRITNKKTLERNVEKAIRENRSGNDFAKDYTEEAVARAKELIAKNDYHIGTPNTQNLYEQTFFTNRAPGDESHLLKWYEPVSEEQKKWIVDALNENIQAVNDRSEIKYGKFTIENGFVKTQMTLLDGSKQTATWDLDKGERAYGMVSSLLGSPETASKLLAEHDIDGIKYPVDSYGKTVKDGDKAGWNYVSFRDDNIRVDHKWRDGQAVFSAARDSRVTPEDDAAYIEAVKRGDMETARRMIREAAEKSGYVKDSSYQGTSAFNGAAPSANGYFLNKAERKAAWKDGSFEDTQTFGDYIFDGIDLGNLDFVLGDRNRNFVTPERREAIDNLRRVLSAKGKTIKMYRSVPSDVKEGSFRNGDWITPSKSYAVENAEIHGWGDNFRIIEQKVPVESIWWDGNDIAEWGFDDGRESVYKNTKNNRKLLGVTYDDAGNVIPLSQRFNAENPDIRFQTGAAPKLNKSRFIAGRARIAADAEMNERTPGAIAASRELNTWKTRPVSRLGAQRYMSLPIADLEQLRKAVTGQTLPALVMKNMANGRLASHTRDGQLLIAADVFGTVDKADMEAEKTTLKQHGFFRNEDQNWCAGQLPGDILREQRRSEDQLATQLLQLGSRRARGQSPGGQEGARGVFADEVATIILEQPRQYGGVLGRIQTLGKGVKDAARQILGSDDRAKQEAGAFLDWAYGGQLTDPATGNPVGRADALTLDQLTSSMFGKWLVMPKHVEVMAPGWSQVFESTIANDQKLADAFRTLGDQHLQKNDYILKKLKEQQSLETEKALAKVWWEGTEPIKASGRLAQAKENLLVGFHDKFSPVYIRVDESVKDIVKAKRATLRAATSATDRARIRAEIERFEGDIAKKMNRLELSRTAYERGSWNEGRLYLMEMSRLENDAYEKWGLSGEDRSLYLEQQRVIETQGRASSFGEDVRTAQMVLDEMKQRIGTAKWAKMEEYGRRFFDIHEREVIDDPRLETMFGKPFADYFRTQQHYVTTKRVFSKEELDAIETERALARQNGVAGGDDVVSQMYAYAGAKGAGEVTGEKEWTAKLAGSFAAKQEVRSATYAKVDRLMQALRRNQFVIDLKDALLEAKVEGVRDMVRTDGAKYPTGDRYGHLNYMVGGQKRVLIVPRQIAEAFKTDADGAKWITNSNNLIRSFLIDYNPAYWLMNIRRNQDSIEKNLPGMRETYLKTGARAVSPGLGAVSDLFLQAIVRKIPAAAKLFSDKTIFAYIPKAERYAKIVEDPSKWQQELWKAEADGDLAKVQQMNEDWLGVREMLKSNMLVPMKAAYRGGTTEGFAFDAMNAKGLKTLEQIDQQNRTKSGLRKIVEAANFLKKNQAQQEHEDILAKTIGYLAMRTHYGLTQSSAESGLAIKKNVSIAEGERSGRLKRPVQQFMAQFFNMVEKGVVRHWKDWKERPGEMAIKDGKVWAGRLASMMFGTGMVVKWMLDDADGDEEKAKAKFGKAFEYAKAYREAYLNCSDYVKENYNITPVWTDGFTSVIIGGGLTDEDKLIVPSADFIAKYLAYAKGIGEKPSLGSAIADSTFKAVTPDLQLASPFVNFLRATVEATMIDNPTDYFRNAPMYDQKLWELRNENWQKRGEFAAAVGMRLWNDFGGRSVLAADVNGVDNGRGTAPETLETVLKRIPWASPMINRMVKVQVGSPAKRGEAITAEQKRRSDVVSLCAAELLKLSEEKVPYNEKDPNGYQAKLDGWKQQYNLSDWDMANLKMKFFNGFMQRANRESFDRQALQRMKVEARRMGYSDEQMWVIFGGM